MDENMNNGMMGNGMMPNQMGGQMMGNGMMQNQMMPNQMNGQMMNNGMMQNQMMPNQMGNQMMNNGMMQNQMMGNPMNAQMMNNGMMQNPMNGQMMNNGMMPNQMMPNQMNGQMMGNGMMQNQMMNNQMYAQAATDVKPAVFDQNALMAKMEREMVNSAEVQSLVQSMDLSNLDAIQMFGREAMDEMSRVSDAVVQDQTRAMLLEGETTKLLNIFSKLFSQIDPKELNEKKGLFSNLKKKLEAFVAKYQKISVDIDKIYAELKRYEEESRSGNRKLATMYDANLNTFHALKIYIYAAEQCTINLNNEIERQTMLKQQTGNEELSHYISKLTTAKQMMEKQYTMLLTAQNVALQSLPQINIQQFTNYNIISKVNEYFLIGLPIMKQGIAQAIMLKRQKLMTESLAGLDKKMNEMMVRNAQNTVDTAKAAMQLSEQTSITAETLETTWKKIVSGIDEVNKIQADGSKKRIESAQKLEKIKTEFNAKFGAPIK